MAKKKKQQEERKPDLAGPDQEVIEEKIKNMLDLGEPIKKEEPKPKETEELQVEPKKVQIKVDEAGSAPELPTEIEEPDQEPEKDDEVEDETDNLEEKQPEKVINLDDAPEENDLLEEMQTKAQESLDKKKPKESAEKANLDEPLLEDESDETSRETVKPELAVSKKEETTKETDKPDLELESKETANAVDDIVAKESDELLEIQEHIPKFAQNEASRKNKPSSKGGLSKSRWNNPKARWITIIICFIVFVVISIIPTSRYFVLNTLGVRANATVVVLDESTGQPLKNVNVELASISARTDANGSAQLNDVKLGGTELKVEKTAFASSSKKVTISLGKNSLDDLNLKPTGTQYSFVVVDYLSGEPVGKIEAISGESSAFSDGAGKIKLTVEPSEKESLDLKFVGEDYRTEETILPTATNTETSVTVVPSKKHAFVSKRTGKYDLYSVDVDGKNEKLLLAGTGNEKDDIALAYKPSTNFVALVSTRDNQKNGDGLLLSNLNIVPVDSGDPKAVASSEHIQIIDWVGDRLIFVQVASGVSADDPNRYKLVSYDSKSGQTTEIASSNYFNDVMVAGEKIYFAPSSAHQNSGVALYRVEADGTGKTTVLDQEAQNIIRVDYENLALASQNAWFNVKIGEDKATSLSAQPANLISRLYADSPDKKSSLWVDSRDGKGVLLSYQVDTKNDLDIVLANGLRWPTNWLNKKVVVYRVSNDQETADYAISLNGGEPKKITDVINTNSLDEWYHY